MRAIQGLLALIRHPRADDSDDAFFWLRVDDNNQPEIDWTDGDEAIFKFRMLCIKDLKVVGARFEEPLGLRERQPVLALVAEIFRIVPLEVHIEEE